GGCTAKGCGVEAAASKGCLDLGNTPGFGSHPAKGDTRLADAAAIHLERHRGRYDRELERGTVAYLEVMRAARRGIGRHRDGGDDLARLEHRLDVRAVARKAVEVDERHGAW